MQGCTQVVTCTYATVPSNSLAKYTALQISLLEVMVLNDNWSPKCKKTQNYEKTLRPD